MAGRRETLARAARAARARQLSAVSGPEAGGAWWGQRRTGETTLRRSLALQCADDEVYLWAQSQLWALSTDNGKAHWIYEFSGSTTTSWTSPVAFWAGNGQVYGPTEKGLTAISASVK
ncbi:hypothetical protein DDE74_11335 [Streptomyces lydicus]|uniref:Uncharacterized protein n=1 Tax=Streptomyces lydicus TaxID=47763 RepID=A0A3Q9K439_9ACTN|nr:hypothetical protein [Streptomyces lydicus]AZS71465.1 hypothetical protein DDE74_11335 [Streptomyces lydicus]